MKNRKWICLVLAVLLLLCCGCNGSDSDPVSSTVSELRRNTADYSGEWMDRNSPTCEKKPDTFFTDILITEIYSDCFFATLAFPSPLQIKLNGTLADEWCVGDTVATTQENVYYDTANGHVEADLLTVEKSDFKPDPEMCYKPVIYLYPEEETPVAVSLELSGELTCTYPAYGQEGWHVTAKPDGTLTDAQGQTYSYLYWEGTTDAEFDFAEGFCVPGKDTAGFLEKALAQLGLNRKEANEFIVYWLPQMESNPYNLIAFQQEAYTDNARLSVTPAPDTVLRVFMTYTPLQEKVAVPEQTLSAPSRQGFTLVEWGGTCCN